MQRRSNTYMSSIVAIRTNTMEVTYRLRRISSLDPKSTKNIFDRPSNQKIHLNALFLYFIVNFHQNVHHHCESFSSSPLASRPPFVSIFSLRYMRSEDRNIHAINYPSLHYPEIYLLEGGYKAFFEQSTVRSISSSALVRIFLPSVL